MNKLLQKSTNILMISLFCGLMATQPALADDDGDDIQKMTETAKAFGFISWEDAKSKALAAKPGVVKEVELERRKFKSGWDYEVEIVDAEGAEWEVYLDAKTGKVNSVNRDWF
ncbi:MAG TPA: PepSY domain-containing protein [Methylophilus sp.]|uniref:PepSY domain-containing protein n=1 Tax=Methylophilus sp. TaxID=29541 RepID=UPI002C3C96E4|nr:PepSY domain-containing protein [Methylophilus sp.]HSH85666.1 PepSY domain-containing protein [Methylophilus sp.]